jgi:ADP-ribose pyrophosphatase YjhB (NUDIX family)
VTARTTRGVEGQIRPVATAVIRNRGRILVWDDHDPTTGEVVAVPIAGGIQFGETGAEAVARDVREELGAGIREARFLGLLEDVFEWNGQRRHELHLVFDVLLDQPAVYDAEEVEIVEDDGERYVARWRAVSEFEGGARLVPDGLRELVAAGKRGGGASGRYAPPHGTVPEWLWRAFASS